MGDMIRVNCGAFLGTMLVLGCAGAADARPKSPVSQWFCSVLVEPFDFAEAVKQFPLEKLPPPEESRKTRKSDDKTIDTVEYVSEGDKYKVTYYYQVNEENISDPFGFNLFVDDLEHTHANDPDAGKKWLQDFGKPQSSMLGFTIEAGEPSFPGMSKPFSVSAWSPDRKGAHWFSSRDIKYSKRVCVK